MVKVLRTLAFLAMYLGIENVENPDGMPFGKKGVGGM
jgi:hypothetical protein